MEDKRWIPYEYGTVSQYDPLETVIEELQKALEDQKTGKWKDLQLSVEDDYGNHYISLTGKRQETEEEYSKRTEYERHQLQSRRATYELLKKEFEGK